MQCFSPRRLVELRKARGLSREWMAAATDRSLSSIDHYENGRIYPPADVICKAADALGVTVADLFEEEVVADAA